MVDGPTAAEQRLFPRVLAMRGKTEIVSRAGKMTTMFAAVLTSASNQKEVVSGSSPIVKFAKLRLTEERVLAPKNEAADVPSNR